MNPIDTFIQTYLEETSAIARTIDTKSVRRVIDLLLEVKFSGGRVYCIGVGGGAGTGSHATNDFHKIAGIPALCLTDNVSLLTALTNDEGWDSVFIRQMEMHRIAPNDCLFIYSVNGGTPDISNNIVAAVRYAKEVGCTIVGVVGRDDGVTAQEADACIIIPSPNPDRRTPHTEDFQLVMNHLISNLLKERDR